MRYNKIIVTIFVVVLLNGAVVVAWLYLFSVISATGAEIATIRQSINFNEKKMENNRLLNELVVDLVDEKEKIDSVFLGKQDIVKFIEEIEYIADQTKTSLKFGRIETGGVTGENPRVQFRLEGDFGQLFHALVLLENIPYVVDISTATFRSVDDARWVANFDVELNNFFDSSEELKEENTTKNERS